MAKETTLKEFGETLAFIVENMATKDQIVALHTQVNAIETDIRDMSGRSSLRPAPTLKRKSSALLGCRSTTTTSKKPFATPITPQIARAVDQMYKPQSYRLFMSQPRSFSTALPTASCPDAAVIAHA